MNDDEAPSTPSTRKLVITSRSSVMTFVREDAQE